MTLYEINKKLLSQLEKIQVDEETGEVLNPDSIAEIEAEQEEKIDATGVYIKELRAEAAAYKQEGEWQAQRARVALNKADALEKYLAGQLEEGKRMKLPHCEIRWRKSEAVEITAPDTLNESWMAIKKSPDKVKIKAALKAGEEIPGAVLVKKISMGVK